MIRLQLEQRGNQSSSMLPPPEQPMFQTSPESPVKSGGECTSGGDDRAKYAIDKTKTFFLDQERQKQKRRASLSAVPLPPSHEGNPGPKAPMKSRGRRASMGGLPSDPYGYHGTSNPAVQKDAAVPQFGLPPSHIHDDCDGYDTDRDGKFGSEIAIMYLCFGFT